MLHRYGGFDCLKQFDIKTIISVIKTAREKEIEEWYHREWCAFLPHMDNKPSFQEYLDQRTGRNIDLRSTDEILADVEEVRRKLGETNG